MPDKSLLTRIADRLDAQAESKEVDKRSVLQRIADRMPVPPTDGNDPLDEQTAREVLRRLGGGDVSPRGLNLKFQSSDQDEMSAYMESLQDELNEAVPGLRTKGQAREVIRRIEEFEAKRPGNWAASVSPELKATGAEKATYLGGQVTRALHGPALGLTRLAFESGALEAVASAIPGARRGDSGLAMRAAESFADPSLLILRDRYRVAQEAVRSTVPGQLAEMGASVAGSIPGLKQGAKFFTGAGMAPVTAGPGGFALYEGMSAADEAPLKAAGGGVAFAALAHGLSALPVAGLSRTGIVKSPVAGQVLGRTVGAGSMAGADAILHGTESKPGETPAGVRIGGAALLGAALGGRIRPHQAAPAPVAAPRTLREALQRPVAAPEAPKPPVAPLAPEVRPTEVVEAPAFPEVRPGILGGPGYAEPLEGGRRAVQVGEAAEVHAREAPADRGAVGAGGEGLAPTVRAEVPQEARPQEVASLAEARASAERMFRSPDYLRYSDRARPEMVARQLEAQATLVERQASYLPRDVGSGMLESADSLRRVANDLREQHYGGKTLYTETMAPEELYAPPTAARTGGQVLPEARRAEGPAEEVVRNTTDLLGGAGKAISENLYRSMWERLEAGKYPEPMRNPTSDKILAAYRRGEIASPGDIRALVETKEAPRAEVPAQEVVLPAEKPKDLRATEPPDPEQFYAKQESNPAERGSAYLPTTADVPKVHRPFVREFGSMISRIGTYPGRTAGILRERALDVVTETKKFLGNMEPALEGVLRKVGGISNYLGYGRAVRNLSTLRPAKESKNILLSPMEDHIEGRVKLKGKEAEIADSVQDLILRRGEELVGIGLLRKDPKTGEYVAFNNPSGVMPRVPKMELFGIMEAGPAGSRWRPVVRAFAQVNNMPYGKMEAMFIAERNARLGIDAEGPPRAGRQDPNPIHQTQAEFFRKLKRVPYGVRIDGDLVTLFEYRPYPYARRLAEMGAARAAFVKVFGQEGAKHDVWTDLARSFYRETGKIAPLNELARALHGLPVEMPWVRGDTPGSRLERTATNTMRMFESTALTQSWVPNLFEPVRYMHHAGAKRLLQATVDLLMSVTPTQRGRELRDMIARHGIITKDFADMGADPQFGYETFTRRFKEVMARLPTWPHHFLNEAQERLGAFTAERFTKDLQARVGKAWSGLDVASLRKLGFPLDLATKMASGDAPIRAYETLRSILGGRMSGSPQGIAERSRLQSRKWFQKLARFQTYAFTSIRDLASGFSSVAETLAQLPKADMTTAQKFRLAGGSVGRLVQMIGGVTVSGALQYLALQFFRHGTTGVSGAISKMEDDPVQFFFDSFIYTGFAGAWGQVARAVFEDGDLSYALFPVAVVRNIWDFVARSGRYEKMEWSDATNQFMHSIIPGLRGVDTAARSIAFATGLVGADAIREVEMRGAINHYYDWFYDQGPGTRVQLEPKSENLGWLRAMKSVDFMVREFATPEEIQAALMKAAGMEGRDWKKVSRSLFSRRLLAKLSPEDKEALRKNRGERVYRYLEHYDAVLELLARSGGYVPEDLYDQASQRAEALRGR